MRFEIIGCLNPLIQILFVVKSLQQLELTSVVGEIVREVGAEDSDIVPEDLGEIFSLTHGIAILKGQIHRVAEAEARVTARIRYYEFGQEWIAEN